MLDLTQHLPQDDLWMDDYAATMGWEALRGYYDRVFLRLMQMCPGEELHVAREVRPENYDLFLKCACAALRELHSLDIYDWHIEQRGTVILRS
jgi:hypothetical protein